MSVEPPPSAAALAGQRRARHGPGTSPEPNERDAYVLDMQGKMWSTRVSTKHGITMRKRVRCRAARDLQSNGALYGARGSGTVPAISWPPPDRQRGPLRRGEMPGGARLPFREAHSTAITCAQMAIMLTKTATSGGDLFHGDQIMRIPSMKNTDSFCSVSHEDFFAVKPARRHVKWAATRLAARAPESRSSRQTVSSPRPPCRPAARRGGPCAARAPCCGWRSRRRSPRRGRAATSR